MGKAFHWWLSKFTHSQGYYLNRLVSSCNWSHWNYYKPIVMFFFKCDFRAEEVAPHSFLFRRKSASENGREVAPHSFPFRRKSASQNGREVAPHHFLFCRKSASQHFSLWGRATHLPFSPKIRESVALLAPQKESHVLFRTLKGTPHEQKRELLRPRNASDPAPDCTAPTPFSPSLVRLAYDPWLCHGMIKSEVILILKFNFFHITLKKLSSLTSVLGVHCTAKTQHLLHASLAWQKTSVYCSQFQFFNCKGHYMFS